MGGGRRFFFVFLLEWGNEPLQYGVQHASGIHQNVGKKQQNKLDLGLNIDLRDAGRSPPPTFQRPRPPPPSSSHLYLPTDLGLYTCIDQFSPSFSLPNLAPLRHQFDTPSPHFDAPSPLFDALPHPPNFNAHAHPHHHPCGAIGLHGHV